jgi:hypothetical protein
VLLGRSGFLFTLGLVGCAAAVLLHALTTAAAVPPATALAAATALTMAVSVMAVATTTTSLEAAAQKLDDDSPQDKTTSRSRQRSTPVLAHPTRPLSALGNQYAPPLAVVERDGNRRDPLVTGGAPPATPKPGTRHRKPSRTRFVSRCGGPRFCRIAQGYRASTRALASLRQRAARAVGQGVGMFLERWGGEVGGAEGPATPAPQARRGSRDPGPGQVRSGRSASSRSLTGPVLSGWMHWTFA